MIALRSLTLKAVWIAGISCQQFQCTGAFASSCAEKVLQPPLTSALTSAIYLDWANQVRTKTRSSPRSPRVMSRSESRKRTSKVELRICRDGFSGSGSCGTVSSGSLPNTPPSPPAHPSASLSHSVNLDCIGYLGLIWMSDFDRQSLCQHNVPSPSTAFVTCSCPRHARVLSRL